MLQFARLSHRAFMLQVGVVVVLLTATAGPVAAQQAEWPGFRGRTGSGVVADALDVDGLAPTVVWRVETGIGYSGVAVAAGKAITMFEDGEQVMVAYDAATGDELWRQRIADSYPGRDGSWNGPIATPVVHGDLVVGFEPWGRLFALSTADGAPVWSVHLADDLGAPRPVYGFASSPIVVGDTLVVHGGAEAGTVLGFDVTTGALRWKVGTEPADAQSPVALTLAGSNMVVAAGAEHIFGIDAATGTVVWEYAHGGDGWRGQSSLVPVGLDDDRIFLAHSDNESQVIGVHAEGEDMVAEQVWVDRTIRNSYTVAVHHEGYIYAYSTRILVCVDAATGELQWRSRKPGDGFLTLVGDEMVILTKDGSIHVAKASPDGFEEIASAAVFEEMTWTPPSLAYGDVFARSLNEVVRIDLHGGGTTRVADVNYNVPHSIDPGDGEFGRFVRTLAASDGPEHLIDAFFAEHPQLPVIEGDRRVHFVYRGDDQTMAIAGDHIGSRQEAPMVRVGETDLFYFSADLLPDARIAYVFVRDSETIPDPRNPLRTATLLFDADREFSFGGPALAMSDLRMPGWELPHHLRESGQDSPRGSLETLTVSSEAIGEAELTVYLPAGYADSTDRYPVVYYHGPTPRELSAVPLSLDNLIAGGMDPVIAVFSEGLLPPGPQYVDFWADEVVPAVDDAYRTIARADGRVGVGSGVGTLGALFIAFARPEMTSGVGLQSIFFLDTDWDALTPLLVQASERPLRIYIDWGAYGIQNPQEAWDLRDDSRRRWKTLEDLGYAPVGGEAPDGAGWAAWRNRADVMLKAILAPGGE